MAETMEQTTTRINKARLVRYQKKNPDATMDDLPPPTAKMKAYIEEQNAKANKGSAAAAPAPTPEATPKPVRSYGNVGGGATQLKTGASDRERYKKYKAQNPTAAGAQSFDAFVDMEKGQKQAAQQKALAGSLKESRAATEGGGTP